MTTFACKILRTSTYEEGPELFVEARSYEDAARAHVACSGPRTVLLFGPIHVKVRRVCSDVKPRVFCIEATLSSEQVSWDGTPPAAMTGNWEVK